MKARLRSAVCCGSLEVARRTAGHLPSQCERDLGCGMSSFGSLDSGNQPGPGAGRRDSSSPVKRSPMRDRSGDKIVASLLLPARKPVHVDAIPLPVVDLGPLVDGGSVGFSLVRIDDTGTVAARAALSQLGWCAGWPIRFEVSSGLLVVARSEEPATVRIPAKMGLVLPARLRSRCRIRAGEQVLLAALVDHDVLVVYPQHVVHEMLTGYHAALLHDRKPRRAD